MTKSLPMPAEEDPGSDRCAGPSEADPEAVRAQLERVVSSDMFSRSMRLSRFLRYVVIDTLENKGRGLKEYAIAREVFGKPEDFDTRLDPIVRVEAGRLRGRLAEYYSTQGNADPVLIELGKRGYRPRFRVREDAAIAPMAPAPGADKETAIAVLPFVDLTEGANQQYFCDGLTEEVIHALTRVKSLQVVSRSSVFQFKGSGRDVRKVGTELGVALVIEGSVRKTGKRLRVTVQLTSAETGFHIWSQNYDTELEDLFAVQESISEAIVATVRQHAGEQFSVALQRRQSGNAKAHRDFLQGLYFQNGTSLEDLERSVVHLQAAIAEDPDYPLAHATLAWSYAKLAWLALRPPREIWPKALGAASRALELDESIAAAHAALGSACAAGEWNWQHAQREFALALETGGDDAIVHQAYAVQYLVPGKRLDEALVEMLLAVERAPNALDAWSNLAWVQFCRGEYREAAEKLKNVLAGQPDYVPALSLLGRSYGQLGTIEKALSTLQIAADISGRDPSVVALLGFYYGQLGDIEQAEKARQELESRPPQIYVPPLAFAHLEIGLGRQTEALEKLREAVEDRSARLIDLDADPIYDALRSTEAFKEIRSALCLT